MNSGTPSPEQMRLIAQVLTLHFEEGRLQSDIAKALGLSSAKVNRLIKQGRELGMVQHHPLFCVYTIHVKRASLVVLCTYHQMLNQRTTAGFRALNLKSSATYHH